MIILDLFQEQLKIILYSIDFEDDLKSQIINQL